MVKIERKSILNRNLSNLFLESFGDLGMKSFWKNLIFSREENNNKDCQLYNLSFKYKNAFLVSVGFSSSGCGIRSDSLVLKCTSKNS